MFLKKYLSKDKISIFILTLIFTSFIIGFFLRENSAGGGPVDLDYDYNLAKDHVNTIFQILSVLRKKFTIIGEYYLPFKIKIIDFNLIHICHIKKNSKFFYRNFL